MNYELDLAKSRTACGESILVSYDFLESIEKYFELQEKENLEKITKNLTFRKRDILPSLYCFSEEIQEFLERLTKSLDRLTALKKTLKKGHTKEELECVIDYIEKYIVYPMLSTVDNRIEYIMHEIEKI